MPTDDVQVSSLEAELTRLEAAYQEAEEQAAYWSRERARLYAERDACLRRCVAVPPVFKRDAKP